MPSSRVDVAMAAGRDDISGLRTQHTDWNPKHVSPMTDVTLKVNAAPSNTELSNCTPTPRSAELSAARTDYLRSAQTGQVGIARPG